MKKTIILILSISLLITNLFATPLSNLSQQSLREYNQKSLSINLEAQTNIYGSANSTYDFNIINTSIYASGQTTLNWNPYQGNTKLSKIDFYNITGYPDEAKRYKELTDLNNKLYITSLSLGIGGLIIFTTGLLIMNNTTSSNSTMVNAGGITGTVGLGIMFSALIPYFLQKDESTFTPSFASRIAEDYNNELLNKLSKIE